MNPTSPQNAHPDPEQTRSIVVLSGGMSDTSSSRMLADRLAQKTLDRLNGQGIPAAVSIIELRPLAPNIAHAIVSGFPDSDLQAAIDRLAAADAVIATTPIYKAGISGLFKAFMDILDNDLLIAVPVVLAATGGSARHALVIDDQLRPLFAFMRTLTTPTSLFAAPEDWGDSALTTRIERAATELVAMVTTGIRAAITDDAWSQYQHAFAGNARPATAVPEVAFDTDLMRLATGGTFTAGA
ncbi:CE1759 family FMN reductase [Arthrobacter sp. TMN-37]